MASALTQVLVSYAALAGLAAILVWVIVEDLTSYRIRNGAVLAAATLFGPWCWGQGGITLFAGNLAFAGLMFVLLVAMYVRHMMGGGDVKLLTTAFLWVGFDGSLLFSVLLSLLALLYTAGAHFRLFPARSVAERMKVPFGPSIAAALMVTLAIQHTHVLNVSVR